MKGEVFDFNGRVAGAVPPIGQEGATPFEIGMRYPETHRSPGWCDVIIGDNIPCRITEEICHPPYVRLFDVVHMICTHQKEILATKKGRVCQTKLPPQTGETFIFWPERFPGGLTVIMADSKKRLDAWNAKHKA